MQVRVRTDAYCVSLHQRSRPWEEMGFQVSFSLLPVPINSTCELPAGFSSTSTFPVLGARTPGCKPTHALAAIAAIPLRLGDLLTF